MGRLLVLFGQSGRRQQRASLPTLGLGRVPSRRLEKELPLQSTLLDHILCARSTLLSVSSGSRSITQSVIESLPVISCAETIQDEPHLATAADRHPPRMSALDLKQALSFINPSLIS